MEPETTSAPVQTLLEYSKQNATTEEVLRSLLSHQGWLAPAMLFARQSEAAGEEQHYMVDKPIVMFSQETELPADELWVFTDRTVAERAQTAGAKLGLYAGEVGGTELFGEKIDPNLRIVRVNPYSPTEQTWQFQQGSYELVKLWAEAVVLEDSFAQGKLDFEAISKFQAFTILNHPSGYAITLPDKAGMKNPAVAFTTPDCADLFLSKLSPDQTEGLKKIVTDGLTLIKRLPLQEIDGIIFNLYGPGPQSYFSFGEIEDVNALG